MTLDDLLNEQTSPEEQARMMAQKLRGQQAIQQASQQANQFSDASIVSQMANNPQLAQAMQMAHGNAMKQFNPEKLGNQGYMLPDSGEFVPSPIYTEERKQNRLEKALAIHAHLQSAQDRQQYQIEAAKERALQGDSLKAALANQHDNTVRQLAGDRNELQLTLQGMRNENQQFRQQQQFEKTVTDFTQHLEKAGVPEMQSAFDQIDTILKKYPKGKIPGIGRGMGAVPDWMLDSESQQVRADLQGVANIILKARSGTAVTDSEMRRFLTEIALGKGYSEETLRHGFANLRSKFDAKVSNLVSGAQPEVLREYNARRGSNYSYAPTPQQPPEGEVQFTPQMAARLKALQEQKAREGMTH